MGSSVNGLAPVDGMGTASSDVRLVIDPVAEEKYCKMWNRRVGVVGAVAATSVARR